MKSAMAIAAAIGLFLLGAMAGGAAMHLYYAKQLERPPMRGHGGPPWLGERLLRQLDLSDQQREEIREILQETRRESEAIRHEIRPQFEDILERSASRVEEVLTPEQRTQYEELRRQHRKRMDSFLGGRGSRRPHRGPPTGR